ncbi:PTH4 protein, partial [Furnarius figulus]|nr:PTH4 protein [Furnarius figulus]
MLLPQRSLQTVTFWAILFSACFATCQDIENRRAVTEHQLMHDKGRAFQGLKRLLWLHTALGTVHTASSRDIPLPSAPGAAQKSQDHSDVLGSSDGDEPSSLRKQ